MYSPDDQAHHDQQDQKLIDQLAAVKENKSENEEDEELTGIDKLSDMMQNGNPNDKETFLNAQAKRPNAAPSRHISTK